MVYLFPLFLPHFSRSEVDSTESLWYIILADVKRNGIVLKLTPPSHYGIS